MTSGEVMVVSLRGSGVSLSGTESALREMSFLMRGTMGHGGGMQIFAQVFDLFFNGLSALVQDLAQDRVGGGALYAGPHTPDILIVDIGAGASGRGP